MYFFIGLNNFINLFIDVITFGIIFEMFIWFLLIRYRSTKVIVLIFLFVLDSNVAPKIPTIIMVEYVFVVNVEILDLTTINMVVKRYFIRSSSGFLFNP